MYKFFFTVLIITISSCPDAFADPSLQFITLGTAGGPQGNGLRAQPANLLLFNDDAWLVDAGDGVTGQLARAGVPLARVKGLFLSHLHFDHTGGVLAVLGLRSQMDINENFTVYGPAGTRKFIDGLLLGMAPAMDAGYGLPGRHWQSKISVHEISGGASLELEGVKVTTAANSHYQSDAETGDRAGFVSLSFRFDTPERSIVYTGDTGPSKAVTSLSKNADLLVIEMLDGPVVLQNLRRANPAISDETIIELTQHFKLHHLSPEQVAQLAAEANIKAVAVTHFVPGANSPEQEAYYRSIMRQYYVGEIIFANDLDRF